MATLIHWFKWIDEAGGIEERIVWEVPKSIRYPEGVRYRLAYIPNGAKKVEVLYDNHHPKGHHKHLRGHESSYDFSGVERLLEDFKQDVERIR